MCIRCPCVCPSSRLGELNYYPLNTCEVDTDTKENDRRVPVSNMDLIEFLGKDQCSMDPHRNTTPNTTQSSDKDTTCQSTMPASRRTQPCSVSANQSDRRRRSLRLKKGGGLLGFTLTAIASLLVLDLLASELSSNKSGGVEAAALRRTSRSHVGNVWERPCGDGRYNAKTETNKNNHIKKKRNHVKDVFLQSTQITNTLNTLQNESHWLDGNWDHIVPAEFKFPDIARFTFRKVHLALQEYMAIFELFTTPLEPGVNDRREALAGTFEKMKKETRELLCLIESVINGTQAANVRRHQQQQRGFSDGSFDSAVQIKGKQPAYRYYTKHVMDRKLKSLREALTEEKVLAIGKVVFANYKNFMEEVYRRVELRAARTKLKLHGGANGNNKVNLQNHLQNAQQQSGKKKQVAVLPVVTRSDSVQKAVNEATKKPVNNNNNANKKNKNRNKLNKQRRRQEQQKKNMINGSDQAGGSGGRRGGAKRREQRV